MSRLDDLKKEAPQIEEPCPNCGAKTQSWRNWVLRGKGNIAIRTYVFQCSGCGEKWRQTKREI